MAIVVRFDQPDQAGPALPAHLGHLAQDLLFREAVREFGHRVKPVVAAFKEVKQPQPQSESGQAGAGQLAEEPFRFGGGN